MLKEVWIMRLEIDEDKLLDAQLEGYLREFIEDGYLELVNEDGEDQYRLTEKGLRRKTKW